MKGEKITLTQKGLPSKIMDFYLPSAKYYPRQMIRSLMNMDMSWV